MTTAQTISVARIGAPLYTFESLPSTQEWAHAAALQGAQEGTAVVAGQQTAGKGRLSRNWWSPPNGGLYVSLVLRPRITPRQLAWVTMVVALGAAEAIEEVCGVRPDLKWPNDLTWQGRKLAGVLAEFRLPGRPNQPRHCRHRHQCQRRFRDAALIWPIERSACTNW